MSAAVFTAPVEPTRRRIYAALALHAQAVGKPVLADYYRDLAARERA